MGKPITQKKEAVLVLCKCGSVIAAFGKGHFKMGVEFKSAMFEVISEGGFFKVVDLQNTQVNVTACTCTEKEVTNG